MPLVTVCAGMADDTTGDRLLSANTPKASSNQTVDVGSGQTEVIYICDSNKTEPTYEGLLISQWIRTRTSIDPGGLALRELLTLKQVSPADDSGTVRFELPVNYDALKTNWASLDMGWFIEGGYFVSCDLEGYDRATNGHCLFWWNINYDSPGQHLLRARLDCGDTADRIVAVGPALPFYSSNVCKFPEGATLF